MPLTTYEEVRPWARAIKEQVLTRRMPKWHAARGFGAFTNDPTLTPIEMTMIVSWVDGGLPRGAEPPGAAAFRRMPGTPALILPPGATEAALLGPARWVSGWSFEPGDPLITSAAITWDGGTIGTWVAGDREVTLPPGLAMRVRGRIRVEVRRRAATDYERPFTAARSVLRFTTLKEEEPPAQRVWTEQAACGMPRTGRAADLLAIRPVPTDGGSARIWLERPGAPKTVIGWFRDVDSRYARAYWLPRAAELPLEARLQADVPCELDLTLAAR